MNPPSALHGAMSRDRKPFTYTPGGLDLSEIKSERMAARLMRNAMNQGVPELPPQIQSPPTPSTPIAVPNFNCLPVQVFPTFNLPANPKSLLRTRSNPCQGRDPPLQRVPPPQPFVNNSRPTEATQYDSFNKNKPTNPQTNNNRPTSMYEYGTPTSTMNYGSDGYTAAFRDNNNYKTERFQTSNTISSVIKSVAPPVEISKRIDNSQNVVKKDSIIEEVLFSPFESNKYRDYIDDTLKTQPGNKQTFTEMLSERNFENKITSERENTNNTRKETDEYITDFNKTLNSNSNTDVFTEPPKETRYNFGAITNSNEDQTALDKDKKEVKVVQKQVVRNEVEEQNGSSDQNGTSLKAVVKLPTKKSAAKTETKVEVSRKTLQDGTIEEVKKTITKTTIDGRTEIKTKTETTVIPKEDEDGDVEEVEEEQEDSNENQESEKVTKVESVAEKSESPKENGQENIIKTEEKSETTTTTSKKITVVQDDDEDQNEEEVVEVEEETEDVEPVTVVLKKPEEKSVPEESVGIEEEEEEEVKQENVVKSKKPKEEEEDSDEGVTIEEVTKDEGIQELDENEEEEVEDEEEYQEAEEKEVETIPESIKDSEEKTDKESSENVEEVEVETEKAETAKIDIELKKEDPEQGKEEHESEKDENESEKDEIEPEKDEIEPENDELEPNKVEAESEKNEAEPEKDEAEPEKEIADEIKETPEINKEEVPEQETDKEPFEEVKSTIQEKESVEHNEKEEQTQQITEEKQEIIVEKEEHKVEKQEVPEEKLEPRVIKIETVETKVPFREPSVPLEKVEDVEIKPIGAGDFITKTHTENTEIITNVTDQPTGVLTEFNRIENIVTVNRTVKTLDQSFDTSQGVPTVKTYFSPHIEKTSQVSPPYQPVYSPQPQQPPTERRHSLLLERLSVERQMPAEIYQNNSSYQYSNQTVEQQSQWAQEPQAEVVTVSNVKPSQITNQQWYQQRDSSVYNSPPSPQPAAPVWSQPKSPTQSIYQPQPQYRASTPQPQPQYRTSTPQPQPQFRATTPQPQPQYRASTPQPQPQYRATTPQPQYRAPTPQPQAQQQLQFQTSYTENIQESQSNSYQNTYSPSTPKLSPNNSSVSPLPSAVTPSQPSQYSTSFLNKDSSESYQTTQQYSSSSYVPPPWEQDSTYVAPQAPPNFYQPPPQTSMYSPASKQGWKPPPPKFNKSTPSAYVPPKPNQSFVRPVTNVEPPRLPGRKTYYSEYERRYISVPEYTYIPGETKFQPQPDPSPKYYYDNNEPAETVEPQWRKELREFTEKTQIQTETTNVNPPWEQEANFQKSSEATSTQTPSWSQTVRPQSWRERSFESEFVSQEWPKTNTLGRGRPLSSYGKEVVAERTRGVSVDRYNPNSYQAPLAAEHPPVQTHTHIAPAPLASGYHNPNVPAYHARASAEPREHVSYQQPRHIREARASPFQSRSFKYLQWITGTDN